MKLQSTTKNIPWLAIHLFTNSYTTATNFICKAIIKGKDELGQTLSNLLEHEIAIKTRQIA